jgi:pyruvate dehydrogenase E1 component alpha subunit
MTYRLPEEGLKVREEKDALKTFRNRVVSAGLLEGKDLDSVETEVAKLIDDAVVAAEASAQPTEADLATDVYVNY